MESENTNRPSEEFDAQRVSYLLESAALAEQGGNARLAIHLYCAAFEAAQENTSGVDERTLEGLRQAWSLACEQGDRATAETIFNDLAPYNSEEQTQRALLELQLMASEQLGLEKEEMEDMAIAFADGIRKAGIDVDALMRHIDSAQAFPAKRIDLGELISSLPSSTQETKSKAPDAAPQEAVAEISEKGYRAEELHPELHYENLSGYELVKEKMRVFGIVDSKDTKMHGFLQQAESFHGVSGPILSQNFLFVGSSREDCGIFAQATANELGWPVITMIVDVNEMGDGSIRVAAPVKRSLFGPPRLMDLPNPCTLVIQNIDILQDLFWGEEQAMGSNNGHSGYKFAEEGNRPTYTNRPPGMPTGAPGGMGAQGQQRSFQHEILSYLGAFFARGGVFVIATSASSSIEQPLVLSEQLESLLGDMAEIAVDGPTLEERRRVLVSFAKEHPSLHDLDMKSLARLSDGMSRYELVSSCYRAVEYAYSESLKTQRHQMVTLEAVLREFMQYLVQGSSTYRLVEDYLVARFAEDLESDLFQGTLSPLSPDQTGLNFTEDEDQAQTSE